MSNLSDYLNKEVFIVIDRPIGSKHPKWDIYYTLNYGYIPGTISGDGEEIDAYVLGVNKPVKKFSGICIAIINRINDNEDKLILAPKNNYNYTDEQISTLTKFQEQYFNIRILR